MELRQLEYFVAVAEELHFGRAAANLAIGQPAVSQQVARLERELGVQLFDRSARRVRLTAAGARLLPEARAVLAAADRVRNVARSGVERPSQTLRLGSSAGMGSRLTGVLGALSDLLPATTTKLVRAPARARLARVASGQLDAAFVRGVTSAGGVELIEVWQDRLLAVLPASYPIGEDATVRLADLAALPLRIVPRQRNAPLFDLVMERCAAAGFAPTLGEHLGSLDDLIAAVGSGSPSWTVIYQPEADTLRHPSVQFVPTEPALLMPTALAVPETATSRQVAPLLRACAAAGAGDHET
ncbi:LysR family transcriptional regulator [Flexivirga oryzae]|uniref:DNA-binding transcriptional LysR family regulator n=1 Tax=Flexivirga oryzae TaxID=1794944 RepID=A0A839NDN7_9MICO|nr:DNA-binding transcriptional LysR family regulator [Flexivirga oryzae]